MFSHARAAFADFFRSERASLSTNRYNGQSLGNLEVRISLARVRQ
jgi:hypothetical protein